jgi:caffeoyl-CoA O-methyltransferase
MRHSQFLVGAACTLLVGLVAFEAAWAQGPGGQDGGRRGPGRRGFGFRDGGDAASLAQPPQGKDDAERKILAVLTEMENSEGYANVSPNDGRLLRLIAETIGAKRVVELGTSTGYSGVWLALALQKTGGHLYTHEIDEGRAKTAQGYFDKAGVAPLVTIIMGDAHETVAQHMAAEEPIDLIFLDADKESYLDYLEKLLPKLRPGGLVLAHNMVRPAPDPQFIEAITTNPELDTTFVLMDGAGISVTLKKR